MFRREKVSCIDPVHGPVVFLYLQFTQDNKKLRLSDKKEVISRNGY